MDGSSIGSNIFALESFMDGPGLVLERVTIESLPDDVLLEIFYQVRVLYHHRWHSKWPELVHVCRTWRFVIFGSPLRLELQLVCTPNTPVRKLLNIWPTFPLIVENDSKWSSEDEIENFFAASEHPDRVLKVTIANPPTHLWERIATVMQEPFPELTSLHIVSYMGVLHLSNTFLNGSASRLQRLYFWAISFPLLPQLLLSARGLTFLNLSNIPNSGYIPPETMATCLAALPKLESFIVQFRSRTPHPKRRNRPLPPQTRSVLPALIEFDFRGMSEYLEVLAARIDAPLLRFNRFKIVFFNQLVFDMPQTIRLFGHLFRTSNLTFRFNASFTYFPEAVFFPSDIPFRPYLVGRSCSWHVRCKDLNGQVSSLAQICSQILSFRSSVESLVIESNFWSGVEIDRTVWLQLFHSFPLVRRLEIPSTLESSIAAALQGLPGEPPTQVFPSLHSLSIVGVSDEAAPQRIQPFLTARQDCGRPIAISRRRM